MNLTEPITETTKPRKRWPWVAGIIAALFVGFALGGTGDEAASATDVAPEPEVVTETVTETVEVTPAACIDALDAAEVLVHQSVIPTFDAVIEVLDAAAVFDVAGIEAATVTINELGEGIPPQVDAYNTAADECRTS